MSLLIRRGDPLPGETGLNALARMLFGRLRLIFAIVVLVVILTALNIALARGGVGVLALSNALLLTTLSTTLLTVISRYEEARARRAIATLGQPQFLLELRNAREAHQRIGQIESTDHQMANVELSELVAASQTRRLVDRMKLSIVMPVHNDAPNLMEAIDRVLAVDYQCPFELVVVDDGSTDDSWDLLMTVTDTRVRRIKHARHNGGGFGVRTGVSHASGTHFVIHHADLSHSPADLPAMLEPVITGIADHVFGARVFGLNTKHPSFHLNFGDRVVTLVANFLFDSVVTDLHSSKVIPLVNFRMLNLRENGSLLLDTELTANLLRSGIRPYEVPVSFTGHNGSTTWREHVRSLLVLFRVRLQRRRPLAWVPPIDLSARWTESTESIKPQTFFRRDSAG